jgi:hypothetical protein
VPCSEVIPGFRASTFFCNADTRRRTLTPAQDHGAYSQLSRAGSRTSRSWCCCLFGSTPSSPDTDSQLGDVALSDLHPLSTVSGKQMSFKTVAGVEGWSWEYAFDESGFIFLSTQPNGPRLAPLQFTWGPICVRAADR